MDITPYLTVAVMLLGILVGTLISPRIQHRVGMEHSRKDLIFQRKLKYFENIIETIEANKKMYLNLIYALEDSKNNSEIKKVIEELKKNRKKFFTGTSSLYFNIKTLSEKITLFVGIEKDIFNRISQLEKNKEEKQNIIECLRNDLENLNKRGDEILYEMKKELAK